LLVDNVYKSTWNSTDLTFNNSTQHTLSIQARVPDVVTWRGAWDSTPNDYYGGVVQFAINLTDSTGAVTPAPVLASGNATGMDPADTTALRFQNLKGTKSYPATPIWKSIVPAIYASHQPGQIGSNHFDVNGDTASMGSLGDHGPVFQDTTDPHNGAAAAPAGAVNPASDSSWGWSTLMSGLFTWNGTTNATLKVDTYNKAGDLIWLGYDQNVNDLGVAAPTNVVSNTITFNAGGVHIPVHNPVYDSPATSGLAGMVLTGDHVWTHPSPTTWWQPNASFVLDATQSGTNNGTPWSSYTWLLTDTGNGKTWTDTTTSKTETLTVQQLINAGFATPTRPYGWMANLSLTVTDSQGDWGTSSSQLMLPEPASMFVLALGGLGVLIRRRRRS
jgi:hypothetical protein